ncbi:MAG: sodium-dependent bicarbonate transport family permease [Dehalococcoidia bacterium]
MMPLDAAATNLTSPPVLAFALGAAATFLRGDLRFPDAIHTAITTYLLLAIGLKGGAQLSESSLGEVWLPAVVAVGLGCCIPLWAYAGARQFGKLSVADSASMAAHYGSVSIVTFTAATAFATASGREAEGFLPALVAMMEIPGIIVALLVAARFGGGVQGAEAIREVVSGRGVLLLGGGLIIGFAAGTDGSKAIEPFFVAPFYGVLVLFLLEMGSTAAERFGEVRQAGAFLLGFGLAMPILNGALGVIAGTLAGLSPEGAAILGAVAGSASYIAAPAAVRIALPEANPGLSLTAALAITFPFNLIAGIPLFFLLADALG